MVDVMTNDFRLHLDEYTDWYMSDIPDELITEVIDSTDWCEHEEFMAKEEDEYLNGE